MTMSLTALAEEALRHAIALDEYLLSQSLPFSSFDNDTLSAIPMDLDHHRKGLINTSQTLKQLAQGPSGIFDELTWSCTDEISLGAIYDYQLAKHVPLEEGSATTYESIAQASGLPQDLAERFLRHAMSSHIFTEDISGKVRHTASSRLLATDADVNDAVGLILRETWPLAHKVHEAIVKYSGSEEPGDTAFGLANNTPGVPMFESLSEFPERQRRFGGAMRYYGKSGNWNLKSLVQEYDWASLDHPEVMLVDIGGGQGTVSCALADATMSMQFVVQDLEGPVKDGTSQLPPRFKNRVKFQEHDFFQDQVVKGADVYLLRWILHDWSDKYALRILRALVPAMKPGTKVLISEWLLPEGPETRFTEKQVRNADLVMLAHFNAKERTPSALRALLHKADPRFRVTNIHKLPNVSIGLLEAIWQEEMIVPPHV